MQRNTTYLNYKLLFYLTLSSLIFISCVYFNTFYNAESSYNTALKIIEESPISTDDKLPNQANKLLGEAIENSKLVIKNYPESKYIDDAVFIIGRASFLRDEVAVAEKHFKMILDLYPESNYYQLSEIWLIYTHFRMGMIDSARSELYTIQARNLRDKRQLFIIHNMLSEIAIETDSLEQVYHNYELAASYAISNSKKTSIYGKLVNIAEKEGNKGRASIYLEELGKVAPDKIRIESKMQWIIYQRELGEYDKIIDEIGNLLGLSEFQSEYIKLELELGKVYMDRGDFDTAKDILSQIVEVYSKKNETAEAYFHMGDMALIEDFNLDLAKEYFEKSKSEKSQSKYGKKSKEILNKIMRFDNLEHLYKEIAKDTKEKMNLTQIDQDEGTEDVEDDKNNLKVEIITDEPSTSENEKSSQNERFRNSNIPMDFDSSDMIEDEDIKGQEKLEPRSENPDSVLFVIGEMLLYDFMNLKLALHKFKSLAEEYPNSGFAPQALYVLSHYEPDGEWYHRLKTDFPNSSFFSLDSTADVIMTTTWIETQRDFAWSLTQKSYEDAYQAFNRLFTKEQDTLSAYIIGFISDIYLNDIELAIQNYQSFVDNFPDHTYTDVANSRLEEIKSNLEDIKDTAQQGINYKIAVNYLHNEYNYDSVKVLLSDITGGMLSSYKNAANSLKIVIRDYEELSSELYQQNTPSVVDTTDADLSIPQLTVPMGKDSLIYQLAVLFDHQLEFVDSARFYHAHLVNSHRDSKYRPYSLIYLSESDPGGNWAGMLSSDYPDTSFTPDSTVISSIYSSDIFEDGFADRMHLTISDCEKYLDFFSVPIDSSLISSDSSLLQIDTQSITTDSVTVKVNSDTLQSEQFEEKGELTP